MEIYQKNTLTKDELLTFFDDLKSDLKSSLLNQIDIEELYAKTILNDNIDTIEFQNTEFQEYLAAKEIVRMGDPNLVIFDLAVEKTIKELYLSWFNTISFVADLDISIVKSILKFTVSEKSSVFIDEENFRFLTKVNVERLSEEDRAYIFEFVFGYYQDILQWIDYSVAKNLPYYFVDSQKKLLKSIPRKKSLVQIVRGLPN